MVGERVWRPRGSFASAMFNLVSEQDEGYKPDLSPKYVPFEVGRG